MVKNSSTKALLYTPLYIPDYIDFAFNFSPFLMVEEIYGSYEESVGSTVMLTRV